MEYYEDNFSICYLLYSIKEEPEYHKIKSFFRSTPVFVFGTKAFTVWLLLESQIGKQKYEEFSVFQFPEGFLPWFKQGPKLPICIC
jgi:hypothetical protein